MGVTYKPLISKINLLKSTKKNVKISKHCLSPRWICCKNVSDFIGYRVLISYIGIFSLAKKTLRFLIFCFWRWLCKLAFKRNLIFLVVLLVFVIVLLSYKKLYKVKQIFYRIIFINCIKDECIFASQTLPSFQRNFLNFQFMLIVCSSRYYYESQTIHNIIKCVCIPFDAVLLCQLLELGIYIQIFSSF